jgi:sulfide:quinone oxidoreductase
MMGFRKNAELSGTGTMEGGHRSLSALADRGIEVVHGTITRVDPSARTAEVNGRTIDADALVVALGVELAPDAVPGLAEHGLNAYDPAEVPRAAEALARLDGGRVVIAIFGAPYTCPPAPYELVLLVEDAARARGASLELTVLTPQPMSLPVLGKAGCEAVESRLALRGIRFLPSSKAERVDAGKVVLQGGGEVPFDLLLAVPPHRCPAVLVEAGLSEPGGWVKVDPLTLQTSADGVWAVGDCVEIPLATGQPMPKAGVFADGEGRAVAERVAARLAGQEPEALFDGQGACWLEVGGGEAMVVRGWFLAQPAPDIELAGASPAHLDEKARYERERLEAWFGPA